MVSKTVLFSVAIPYMITDYKWRMELLPVVEKSMPTVSKHQCFFVNIVGNEISSPLDD